MRLIFGIIIGIALTVGGAWIVDSIPQPPADGGAANHMVNWDVVQRRFVDLGQNIHTAWNNLTGANKPVSTSN